MTPLRLQYTHHFWREFAKLRRNPDRHIRLPMVRQTILQGVEAFDGQNAKTGESYWTRTLSFAGRHTLEVSIVKKRGYILVVSVYWLGYHD